MKKKNLATILMLVLVLIVGTSATCLADGLNYKYTINVYSGNEGLYKEAKEKQYVLDPGQSITIDIKDVQVTNSKYYAKGFRIAGHDNDEALDETTGFYSMTFNAKEDVSYEVAYGIKGKLVPYKVNYIDGDGNSLRGSDTYYGMLGDKPAVSFKYVEGYEPDSYYKAKKLTGDESQDVVDFVYTAKKGQKEGENEGDNGNGDNGNGNGNGNANGNGNGNGAGNGNGNGAAGTGNNGPAAPGTPGNPAGTNTANNATINDNATPLGDEPSQFEDLDADDSNSINLWLILAALGVAVLLAALLLALKKRRKAGEEEFDEDDLNASFK